MKTNLETDDKSNLYSCCLGGKTDRRVLSYVTQIILSLIVITFCIVQLTIDDSAERVSIYLPLICSILGYFLPHPSIK